MLCLRDAELFLECPPLRLPVRALLGLPRKAEPDASSRPEKSKATARPADDDDEEGFCWLFEVCMVADMVWCRALLKLSPVTGV